MLTSFGSVRIRFPATNDHISENFRVHTVQGYLPRECTAKFTVLEAMATAAAVQLQFPG